MTTLIPSMEATELNVPSNKRGAAPEDDVGLPDAPPDVEEPELELFPPGDVEVADGDEPAEVA